MKSWSLLAFFASIILSTLVGLSVMKASFSIPMAVLVLGASALVGLSVYALTSRRPPRRRLGPPRVAPS